MAFIDARLLLIILFDTERGLLFDTERVSPSRISGVYWSGSAKGARSANFDPVTVSPNRPVAARPSIPAREILTHQMAAEPCAAEAALTDGSSDGTALQPGQTDGGGHHYDYLYFSLRVVKPTKVLSDSSRPRPQWLSPK